MSVIKAEIASKKKPDDNAFKCFLVCQIVGLPLAAILTGIAIPVLVKFYAYALDKQSVRPADFVFTILASFYFLAFPTIVTGTAVAFYVKAKGQPKFWPTLIVVDAVVFCLLGLVLIWPHWDDVIEFGSNFYFERAVAVSATVLVILTLVITACWHVADRRVFSKKNEK